MGSFPHLHSRRLLFTALALLVAAASPSLAVPTHLRRISQRSLTPTHDAASAHQPSDPLPRFLENDDKSSHHKRHNDHPHTTQEIATRADRVLADLQAAMNHISSQRRSLPLPDSGSGSGSGSDSGSGFGSAESAKARPTNPWAACDDTFGEKTGDCAGKEKSSSSSSSPSSPKHRPDDLRFAEFPKVDLKAKLESKLEETGNSLAAKAEARAEAEVNKATAAAKAKVEAEADKAIQKGTEQVKAEAKRALDDALSTSSGNSTDVNADAREDAKELVKEAIKDANRGKQSQTLHTMRVEVTKGKGEEDKAESSTDRRHPELKQASKNADVAKKEFLAKMETRELKGSSASSSSSSSSTTTTTTTTTSTSNSNSSKHPPRHLSISITSPRRGPAAKPSAAAPVVEYSGPSAGELKDQAKQAAAEAFEASKKSAPTIKHHIKKALRSLRPVVERVAKFRPQVATSSRSALPGVVPITQTDREMCSGCLMAMSLLKEYTEENADISEVRYTLAGVCDEPVPVLEETCQILMYKEATVCGEFLAGRDTKAPCLYVGLCF